jgi:hypothetical protein
MPLISILLGLLCLWMITFFILALRSTSNQAADIEETATSPTPSQSIETSTHIKQVSTKQAEVYQTFKADPEVPQMAGATQ